MQIIKENEAIDVQLCKNADIIEVCLYDNPNRESNILGGSIFFDTGDIVNFGALDPSGNMTQIECNVKNVKSFQIVVKKTEGGAPGLTEIEAYQNIQNKIDEYIKIIDDKNNFCYDYWLEDGVQAFTIYSLYGNINLEDCTIELQGDGDEYYDLANDYILVYCPKGKTCMLTVKSSNVSDTIKISNPLLIQKAFLSWLKKFNYEYAICKNFFVETYEYYRQIYTLRYKK